MISKNIKKLLADKLAKRNVFTATTIDGDTYDKDAYLTYHAMEMFDGIVIQEEYDSANDRDTQYLYFNLSTKELRDCKGVEDNYMRSGDLEDYPFREEDCEYIISKGYPNEVRRFDDVDKNEL